MSEESPPEEMEGDGTEEASDDEVSSDIEVDDSDIEEEDDDDALEDFDIGPPQQGESFASPPPRTRQDPPVTLPEPVEQSESPEPSAVPSGPGITAEGFEEVIEKKNGQEQSNFTIREAFEAGTLKPGVYYRTKKGGLFTNLGLVAVKLTERQFERMQTDPAYREEVFKKGP
jgi:hypothetical protein